MIKIGDRVKFVSDTGVGTVLSIEKGIVNVEVDGFPRPTPISEIVVTSEEDEKAVRQRISPDLPMRKAPRETAKTIQNTFGKITIEDDYEDEPIDLLALKRSIAASQASNTPDQQPQVIAPPKPQFELTDYDLSIALVPTKSDHNATHSDIEVHIVNDCSYDTYFTVGMAERQGFVTTISHGLLEAGCKTLITTLSRRTLSTVKTLHVQMLPFKTINFMPKEPVISLVELHPVKLSKDNYFRENDFFEQAAYLIKLV